MSGKSVMRGRLYKGELIMALANGMVVIIPTWLGGTQVTFGSESEAQAYVDAHDVWAGICELVSA